MNCWTPSNCCFKLLCDRVKLGSLSSNRVKLGTSFPIPAAGIPSGRSIYISSNEVYDRDKKNFRHYSAVHTAGIVHSSMTHHQTINLIFVGDIIYYSYS